MGNEREMGYRTGLIGEKVEARKRRRSREGLTGFDKSVGNNGPDLYPRNRGQTSKRPAVAR